jgi:hypothetical protein
VQRRRQRAHEQEETHADVHAAVRRADLAVRRRADERDVERRHQGGGVGEPVPANDEQHDAADEQRQRGEAAGIHG